MSNGPKQILFERGHKEGQETYEYMLKVTNHQRDSNQNNNEVIISQLSEWLSSTNQQRTSAGEDAEKKKPSCTAGRNADWYSHCGKQFGISSKN